VKYFVLVSKLFVLVTMMSSCIIIDTYTANKLAKFPDNLTYDHFVKNVDSINAHNFTNGFVIPAILPSDKEKIRSNKNLGLYRAYLFNTVSQKEKSDSVQFYLNRLSGIHKKYIISNDVSRRMSGIGSIVYSKYSFFEKMRDSVNSVMKNIDRLSHVNYNRNPYYYYLYGYVKKKKPLLELRDKDILDGKLFYTTNPIDRFRLYINPFEFSGSSNGMGIGASLEPTYKWTNNSSFGLKLGYNTFFKNASDYSFYSQQNSSLLLTYNFIPYGNSDILSGTSNYLSFGGGIVHTQISGVDDRIYINNNNVRADRFEDQLFKGVVPMLVIRDGIQSRFFKLGVEFNLIPSVGLLTNDGNYDKLLNSYFAFTYGLIIGSRKWK
jgi:hypothetical protein